MNSRTSLLALSPLDGRYLKTTRILRDYFSESALIKKRIFVEIKYLTAFLEVSRKIKLTGKEKQRLQNWQKKLTLDDIAKVKQIEKEIKHDVKAVEYFIRLNLKLLHLEKLSTWIHWGLTSEDINNLSYSLMVQEALRKVMLPKLITILDQLILKANQYQSLAMLARTHGQVAVPTTFGKEIAVFLDRISFFLKQVIDFHLGGKLNGAVGNFNAHQLLMPQIKWAKFSDQFIRSLDLEPVIASTQIEPSSRLIFLLDNLRQINLVFLDLVQDFWLYISQDYLNQKTKDQEVGSSTMPHKVNPIDFENSEGNLQMANTLLQFLSNKLPVSRLQRDLSDSTVKRNLGSAFGYTLIAWQNLFKGLKKIIPNKIKLQKDLQDHPEALSEAIQLKLKMSGDSDAYEKLKKSSRGKKILLKNLLALLPKQKKQDISMWAPETYIGLSEEITKSAIKNLKQIISLKEVNL